MAKSKGVATIAVIIVITLTCTIIGVVSQKYLGPDNFLEDSAEGVIKEQTGLSVDFSPQKNDDE